MAKLWFSRPSNWSSLAPPTDPEAAAVPVLSRDPADAGKGLDAYTGSPLSGGSGTGAVARGMFDPDATYAEGDLVQDGLALVQVQDPVVGPLFRGRLFSNPASIPFNWLDASGGTVLAGMGDESTVLVDVGEAFPIGALGDFQEFTVTANGSVIIGNYPADHYAGAPPGDGPNGFSPCAADLDPSLGGAIRWAIVGTAPARVLVFEYDDVPAYNQSAPPAITEKVRAQLHIPEDGTAVEFHIDHLILDPGDNRWLGVWWDTTSHTRYVSLPGPVSGVVAVNGSDGGDFADFAGDTNQTGWRFPVLSSFATVYGPDALSRLYG